MRMAVFHDRVFNQVALSVLDVVIAIKVVPISFSHVDGVLHVDPGARILNHSLVLIALRSIVEFLRKTATTVASGKAGDGVVFSPF